MSDDTAREILVKGARALAHVDGLESSLQVLIDAVSERLEIGSVVIAGADPDQPGILVSVGLDDAARAGLSRAIGNPAHPIPRTAATRIATFDVLPTVPGGPALRSHLPLVITRNGSEAVLGVLALAYDRPLDEPTRSVLTAIADLAAVAIEMSRLGRG